MRKGFAAYAVMAALISLLAVSMGYSLSYTFSRDWGTSTVNGWVGQWPRQIYSMGYNSAAYSGAKMYINDGANIRIVNATNGALIDTDFPTPSSFDRLSSYSWEKTSGFYFANGVADDGVLFATSLNAPAAILYRWANDAATATSQTVVGQVFCRNLNPRGSGVNTKIYTSQGGQDNDEGQIVATADGLNFYLAEVIGQASNPAASGNNSPFGKSDCAVKDATTLFGLQPWGLSARDIPTSGHPDRWDKIGPNWVRSATFTPPLTIPGGASCWCAGGGDWLKVDPADPRYGANGGLLVYMTYAQTSAPQMDGWLIAAHDVTGNEEGRLNLKTQEGAQIFYYHTLRVDNTNRKIYWAARQRYPSTSQGNYGRYTAVYVGSGVSDWELY